MFEASISSVRGSWCLQGLPKVITELRSVENLLVTVNKILPFHSHSILHFQEQMSICHEDHKMYAQIVLTGLSLLLCVCVFLLAYRKFTSFLASFLFTLWKLHWDSSNMDNGAHKSLWRFKGTAKAWSQKWINIKS